MKKIILSLIIFSIFFSLSNVYANNNSAEMSPVDISINVLTGNAWIQNFSNTLRRPQIVIWLEDSAGNFVKTFYITRFYGRQSSASYKNFTNTIYLRKTLPLWLGRQYTQSKTYPTKQNPVIDSIAGATPENDIILAGEVASNIKKGSIYIEVNTVGDHNSTYTDRLYGQPSLVYNKKVDYIS